MLFINGCSNVESNHLNVATEVLIQDTDCFGDEVHPVAESIAEDYSHFTDYDEVMVWYCNGAEFNDILNGLLTEEMTGTDTEELLRRVADGESWNDIWITLDIIEE